MKQFFLLTILLLSYCVYGQDTAFIKKPRLFIGISFSPDYCYRTLTKSDDTLSDALWERAKKTTDSIESPKISYTVGISFSYLISKHLSIETGIYYSNKGYKTVPILTVYNDSEPPEKATNIYNYTYMDFPLKVNYTFLKKRFQIQLSVGAELNLLRQVSVKTIPETPTETFKTTTYVSHYDFNKINISPTVSVGFKYKINSRMNLLAAPTFRYGLLKFDKQSYATIHLWSVGLNLCFNIGQGKTK